MLGAIKRLFNSTAAPNALWKAMEEMDPWLSYERFQAIDLPKRARPVVQGLVEGSTKPGDVEGVRRWAQRHREDYNGINALVFALQQTMNSKHVHYLFEEGVVVPTARIPSYTDDAALVVLFSDRVNHLQIASVDEFTTANEIDDYVLEPLTFSQFETRIERRSQKFLGAAVSHENKEQWLHEGRRLSVSIARKTSTEEQLEVPVTAADVARALRNEGFNVPTDGVQLEAPIHEPGLFEATVEFETGVRKSASVWVVPEVE